jgi:hypothetical protein
MEKLREAEAGIGRPSPWSLEERRFELGKRWVRAGVARAKATGEPEPWKVEGRPWRLEERLREVCGGSFPANTEPRHDASPEQLERLDAILDDEERELEAFESGSLSDVGAGG